MSDRSGVWRLLLVAAVAGGLCGVGCDGGGTPGQIAVKLVNDTSVEVDPHLYVSSSVVSSDELFTDTNMYADFDGSGVIEAGATVTVAVACGQFGSVGSQQASFGSWEDWTTAGRSAESPVVDKGDGPNDVSCGGTITFRFHRDTAGTYHTNVSVAASQ